MGYPQGHAHPKTGIEMTRTRLHWKYISLGWIIALQGYNYYTLHRMGSCIAIVLDQARDC